MKNVAIQGTARVNRGTTDAKNLRKQGLVPCVIYGGKDNVHFYADERAFKDLIFTDEVRVAEIEVDGTTYRAILKDTQYHPVKDNLLHADFLELVDDKAFVVNVPVKLMGNPIGVRNGGKLSFTLRKLTVRALPQGLPSAIEIPVEHLRIGHKLAVSAVPADGFEILNSPDTIIVSVKRSRNAVLDDEEEGEEGEAGGAEAETAAEAAE